MASFDGINLPRKLVTLTLCFAGGCRGISYLLGCSVPAGANEPHPLSTRVACADIMEGVKKSENKKLSTVNMCAQVPLSPAEQGLCGQYSWLLHLVAGPEQVMQAPNYLARALLLLKKKEKGQEINLLENNFEQERTVQVC